MILSGLARRARQLERTQVSLLGLQACHERLERREVSRLARAIRRALTDEIMSLGSGGDAVSYLSEGAPNHFRVYGRVGERCRRCRTAIEKIVQAARSSYYCPNCQPRLESQT